MAQGGGYAEGRLRARPVGAPADPPPPVPERGDFLLRVPTTYRPGNLAPLTVMLHGAAARAGDVLALPEGLAERVGLILLAPNSQGYTWDVLLGGYGPDVATIDLALEWTFASHTVDPARVAIGGFSDGASYALSLGLTNGDLFTHVLAFSPGFAAPARRVGSPRVFVSHGTRDAVLPIDRCSRRISSPRSSAPATTSRTGSSTAATRSRPRSCSTPRAGSPQRAAETARGPEVSGRGGLRAT